MRMMSYENLSQNLIPGKIYRREALLPFSKAIDRDLATLTVNGELEKLATGLYYKPRATLLGKLPPKDEEVISCFLNDTQFLLYSWNNYNALGLGLTQLYNQSIVYNYKRHGLFKLGNRTYDFRRPARGFPEKLTPEFLIVDLLNNIKELAEDSDAIKEQVKQHLHKFDLSLIADTADRYGKVSTRKFFKELQH